MTASDDKKLSARYRAAPRAESPDHLDARIMQVARDHAPAAPTRRGIPWAPALASACLAGLALYVVTPLLSPEHISPVPRQADAPLREQKRQLEAADTAHTSQIAAPAASPATDSVTRTTPGESTLRQTEEAGSLHDVGAVSKQRSESFTGDEEGLSRSSSSVTARSDGSLKEKSDHDDSVIEEVSELRAKRLSPTEIDRRLSEITDLANRELVEEAQRLLDALIARCPDCALPESVVELQLNDAASQSGQQ